LGGLFLLRDWRIVRRLRQGADLHAASLLGEHVRRWQAQMGLRDEAQVALSGVTGVPLLLGGRRPVLLLPTHLADPGHEQARDAAIIHELAHLRQGDTWALPLARLTCVVLWWHPLAWVVAAHLRATAEELCDDWVVALTGSPDAYAKTLVEFAEAATMALAPVSCVRRGRVLVERLRRILSHTAAPNLRLARRHQVALGTTAAGAVLAAILLRPAAQGERERPTVAPQVGDDTPRLAKVTPAVVEEQSRPHPKPDPAALNPPLVARSGPYRATLTHVASVATSDPTVFGRRALQMRFALIDGEGRLASGLQPGGDERALDQAGRPLAFVVAGWQDQEGSFTYQFVHPGVGIRSLREVAVQLARPADWGYHRTEALPIASLRQPTTVTGPDSANLNYALELLESRRDRLPLYYPSGHYGHVGSGARESRAAAEKEGPPPPGTAYATLRFHVLHGKSNWQLTSMEVTGRTGEVVKDWRSIELNWRAKERGYLGIGTAPLTPERRQKAGVERGAYVLTVTEDSPAHRAGVKRGDVVVELNGEAISGRTDLIPCDRTPGETVRLALVRAGKRRTVSVRLGSRPLWDGVNLTTLQAAESRLAGALRRETETHEEEQPAFAEWRWQSQKPLPESFTPDRVVFVFARLRKPVETFTFTFRDVPVPQNARADQARNARP